MPQKIMRTLLCGIAVLLLIYVFFSEYNRKLRQDTFVNHVYFMLIDVHGEIAEQSPEDAAKSAELHDNLLRLDQIFLSQSYGILSWMDYYPPWFFEGMDKNITSSAYEKAELEELAMDLQTMIDALSDGSGRNSDDTLTVKELKSIFSPFFSKWG